MVYVISKNGRPIMPTDDHRKVRLLIKSGRAKVVRRSPFTIKLLTTTHNYTQLIVLGVDAGSKHVGLSACTGEKELFRGELQPRNDVVSLLSGRREMRRGRRNRKTRYRQPRFNNRVHSKHKGWLAPSVEVKIHNHIQGIRLVMKLLPVTKVVVEVAEFDTQRLKAMEEGRPLPQGVDYQQGEQLDSYNVRQFVLHRDSYTFQCCGAHPTEKKPVKLHVHHLESRKIGGNAPNNLITLCEKCHKLYHAGKVKLRRKRGRSYRDASFMGIMRRTLQKRLSGELEVPVRYTFGYITKYLRELHRIEKTHTSDARCISGAPCAAPAENEYLIKPVRRHNRQIHKCSISKGGYRKLNQAPKYVRGFQLFDMVDCHGEPCFVFGRRAAGSFDIRHLNGEKVSAGVSCKKLKLLQSRSNLLVERRELCGSSPWLKRGASAA